ncbi:MAG: chemotaxis protein CheW [Magnetococcales bacterium]|nr:chemotaxis protein CheW [Magnetococcales bacterium]NGZ26885.1 chemotaxis protein CheW [Magnetococcales bacterium]
MNKQANIHGSPSPFIASPPYELTVCRLGQQKVALPSEFIQEVLHSPVVYQRQQGDHQCYAGTMDLRGLQLPTFHLGHLLHLPDLLTIYGQKVLVCRLLDFRVGLLVDAILENISLPPDFIQPNPTSSRNHTTFFNKAAWLGSEQMLPILEMNLLTSQLQHLMYTLH